MDWFAPFMTIKGGIPLLFVVLWLINAAWVVNKQLFFKVFFFSTTLQLSFFAIFQLYPTRVLPLYLKASHPLKVKRKNNIISTENQWSWPSAVAQMVSCMSEQQAQKH